ncbi:Lanthionine synthetase C-like, partial [Dillenia turbinata]
MAGRFFPNQVRLGFRRFRNRRNDCIENRVFTVQAPCPSFPSPRREAQTISSEHQRNCGMGDMGKKWKDHTLYSGALGTAFLLFKSYNLTNNQSDLKRKPYMIKLPKDLPYEQLYGRRQPVVAEIFKAGSQFSNKGSGPLMYEWNGKKYWGAAHGLAGIMHVLMDMELKLDEKEDVKDTLHCMIRNRFPNGNYPSSKGSETDRLVQWCHGASGVALTLAFAPSNSPPSIIDELFSPFKPPASPLKSPRLAFGGRYKQADVIKQQPREKEMPKMISSNAKFKSFSSECWLLSSWE